MLKAFPYTQTDSETFENIFKADDLLMNHVVIPPGKVFPKHPTDAWVYAVVVRGTLSIAVENQVPVNYGAGQVVHIPKGVPSELGNRSEELVELFVVKYLYD